MSKKRLLVRILLPLILLSASIVAIGQTRTITGKITDSKDGSPLSGVSVIPKGSTKGTTTGADGTFSITVNSKSSVLIFSSVGFATQQLPINGNNFSVAMVASNTSLNEVVVIGYGTTRKKDLTCYFCCVRKRFPKRSDHNT